MWLFRREKEISEDNFVAKLDPNQKFSPRTEASFRHTYRLIKRRGMLVVEK